MAKPTSAQDSNSKEKTFKSNCNPFCQMKSDWLSLTAKLVGAGLDSILSHVRTRPQKLRYWFSNLATLTDNEKSLKMSWPSSTSLVAAWARYSENINSSKYAKIVSYQVYLCQKLGVIRKKWVRAVGKVYNILMAYLGELQGFTKISNSGEKRGLKMVLKTSGLIPQWCSAPTMATFRHRIQDLRSECDRQIPSDLIPTYVFIVFPKFEMSQMLAKKSRNLRSKTARSIMILAGVEFTKTLKSLCYLDGSKLVWSKEESTSKTF